MSCAWRLCIRPVVEHGVCPTHLLATYAAGRRAENHAGASRLTALLPEMRAA